jgi:hypothetical protein
MFCGNAHSQWDSFLSDLTFAFNTCLHSSTGKTPARIFFGRELPHPLSNLWGLPRGIFQEDSSDEERESCLKEVLENLKKAKVKQKELFNKLHSPVTFEVGDLVLSKNHPISSKADKRIAKLMPKWEGPFAIKKFVSPVTVLLNMGPDKEKICHVSQLKAYFDV